jgi:hypothetical protein
MTAPDPKRTFRTAITSAILYLTKSTKKPAPADDFESVAKRFEAKLGKLATAKAAAKPGK